MPKSNKKRLGEGCSGIQDLETRYILMIVSPNPSASARMGMKTIVRLQCVGTFLVKFVCDCHLWKERMYLNTRVLATNAMTPLSTLRILI